MIYILIVDKKGDLFDDRRKNGDRRKETVEVENDRRKGERRTENQTRNNGESEKDGE